MTLPTVQTGDGKERTLGFVPAAALNRTSPHYDRVLCFMEKFEHEIPTRPSIGNATIRRHRARLILEEALETVEALGCKVRVSIDAPPGYLSFDGLTVDVYMPEEGIKLPEIAKELADLSVVTTGTFIALGIPDVGALELVDENNLSKFGPGHYVNKAGKLIKPVGHPKPDLAGYLRGLGWEEPEDTQDESSGVSVQNRGNDTQG